jgi:hypothetical protein
VNAIALLGIIALFAAPLVTYLVAARQFSGKIATSDATDLWEESRSIRDWSQKRINELNDLVVHLERRVAEVEVKNHGLTLENDHLLQKVGVLEKENVGD